MCGASVGGGLLSRSVRYFIRRWSRLSFLRLVERDRIKLLIFSSTYPLGRYTLSNGSFFFFVYSIFRSFPDKSRRVRPLSNTRVDGIRYVHRSRRTSARETTSVCRRAPSRRGERSRSRRRRWRRALLGSNG